MGETREIGLSVLGERTESRGRLVQVEKGVLERNRQLAEANRRRFEGLLVLNVLSSPGSGKTTLLVRTLGDLKDIPSGVIVGDLATDNDAERLRAIAETVQIQTGGVCHLEADMIAKAANHLELGSLKLLVIENVGNLVCPAAYDLGEDVRVVLLSVVEGEDKPLKYPKIFKSADAVILTKIDLAEAAGFDREAALESIRLVNPRATVLEVSARTGAGLESWYGYLGARL